MEALKIVGMILAAVAFFAIGSAFKYYHCKWLAPDHIGYCMVMRK